MTDDWDDCHKPATLDEWPDLEAVLAKFPVRPEPCSDEERRRRVDAEIARGSSLTDGD